MSPKNGQTNVLNIIRERLERASEKMLNEGDRITPHNITEGLKSNADDRDELTCVGHLVREVLGEERMIRNVSWIAFRFYFPGREFSYSERDMRNWVSIRNDSQELLNAMHEVVREEFQDHQDIYAPSVLFPQMSRAQSENPELMKRFRERWWLYRLTDDANEFCPCQNNNACRSEELKDIEIISFEERETPDGRAARLAFCPPVPDYPKTLTLGDLIKESEEESLRKFHNFKNIVRLASDGKIFLNCDFYVRVPLFFRGTEQEYMTDIFVALGHARERGEIVSRLEVGEIIRILDDVVPALKTCVSLINSQVAYSLGEVTRRDKMAGLLHAVIRHDINNFAAAVDISASQLHEYWDILDKEEAREIIDEIRANVILSTMFIGLDFLWSADVKDDPDNFISTRQLGEELDRSWRFGSVINCEFRGDWSSERLVPKVCRVVLSSLLRNAIDSNDQALIRLDCRFRGGKVEFGCLSEKEFSEVWRHRAFEAPLPLKIPKVNRGLWVCRYIADTLGGELCLAPGEGEYKTNIRFRVPTR